MTGELCDSDRKCSVSNKVFNIRANQCSLSRSVIHLTITVSSEVPPPTECEDVEDLGGPDVKEELPTHLSITKDVMERCIHLLSDPSLRLRLKVLHNFNSFTRRRFSKCYSVKAKRNSCCGKLV